ncbi:Calcium-transporting ATPase [Cocos nucifera]|uniref:Calcium-transporting ATPase n=1 Tax=Cocos nucifera TaxID=13894 RepID=A0A8K0N0L4_COCNU|nr:Calcium-transporting ATPase [Cocos nucifera]
MEGRGWGIDSYLKDNFDLPAKNPSEDAQRKWRSAVGKIVKNRRRRFRMVPDLDKRSEEEAKKRKIQEKIRVALYVQQAAFHFIDAANRKEHHLSEEVIKAGFSISPDELASIASGHDIKSLKMHGGVEGISRKINVSLDDGVNTSDFLTRQNLYGANRCIEKPSRSFWMFVWDAVQDLTLIILMICALISIVVGLATEGWPKGVYDGLGILLSIFLVVMVTAVSDYKQSLQFKELDKEKKNIVIHVTRDGSRQKVSIYDLVVGDIVHLSIGDQVPADGLFISGYSLLIDESSLSGESEPVYITKEKPFLLAGTTVQDGSAKMLVTAVGMRTEWGRLMCTLSQGGEDETPLQVKLNGVATIIGKIGLVFATLTFVVLIVRFLVDKGMHVGLLKWFPEDALTLLNYFAISVTIIVVAVPEGLPLAVTLSLAFAMKKLMDDKALVRHLSACETMGSASCICTDKTGTLTTNRMVVDKIWICEVSKSFRSKETINDLKAVISEKVLSILLQCIFENSGSEVVKGKDGKNTIMGTPTEAALLEFGLELEGECDAQHRDCKKLRVEPFNSVKKKMSVLVSLPGGRIRAFCKGASEILLQMCDKIIDSDGKSVPLSEVQTKNVLDIINTFACEALRTLCLAFKDMDETYEGDKIPADGYTLIAVFGIKDPVRPGVRDAVQTCIAAGVTVRMVTGDNINTAKAIARECGILTDDGLAIEGSDFRNKSPEEMKDLIPKIQVMARSLPLDKHTLVTKLRSMFHEVVAVTGDGTNDAPALHEADIGLAMVSTIAVPGVHTTHTKPLYLTNAITGQNSMPHTSRHWFMQASATCTQQIWGHYYMNCGFLADHTSGLLADKVAKESADVIILDDNFSTIINVARWGRAVYINIQKFVQFQLTVNVVALIVNFVSACITGSTPLTAVQLLWVNMIMDTLGALALATEPPNDEMMKRPPVKRGESFITRTMWRNIIGQSLYQLVVLGTLMFAGKRLLNIEGSNADSILNTLIFNSFVFCQVFNEINSLEMDKINVFYGIFSNWIFVAIIASTVIFQVIIVEFLGTFASTVPLSWELWLVSVLLGSISLIVGIILKCIPVKPSRTADKPNGYEPIPSGPEAV